MPIGSSAVICAIVLVMFWPKRKDVAAVPHGDCEPYCRLAVDPEHRVGRIGVAAPHPRNIAQAKHAPAGGKIDVGDVLLGLEAPETRSEMLSAPVCIVPAGRTMFWACSAAIRADRSIPRVASSLVENSTKITSSCAPRISIFDTSGTRSSFERMSST